MKLISKLITYIIFFYNIQFAQNVQSNIKVTYGLNLPTFENKMSDENYAELIIQGTKSLFVYRKSEFKSAENSMIKDESGYKIKVAATDEVGCFVYRDFDKDTIIFREIRMKELKPILVTDKWEVINWMLTNETKKIDNFECKKATCKFRGRDYTAFYTEEIPLNVGPWKFYGLPGLILEVFDSKKEFNVIIKSIDFNFVQNEIISVKKNGNETKLDFEEFKNYNKNYVNFANEVISAKLPRGAKLITGVKGNLIEKSFE